MTQPILPSTQIVIQPIFYFRVITLIIALVFLPMGWVFILADTTISVIFGGGLNLLIIWIVVYIFMSKLGYNEEFLIKRGIIRSKRIKIDMIEKISKIKLFGTVGRVPISVASVKFDLVDGTSQVLDLHVFPYIETMDLLEKLANEIGNSV